MSRNMFNQQIETSSTPHVTVEACLGNLVVRGGRAQRVSLRVMGEAEDVDCQQDGETLAITLRSDCTITCPPATTLTVDSVQGNLKVDGIEGAFTVGIVHGNAHLRTVGPATMEQTFGNLSVRRAAGDLRAQVTRGNARVHQVEGALSLDQVDGNLKAEGLHGGLDAEQVHGNVRLGPPFSPGQTYRLNASGNLTLRLPASTSLRLALRAGGRVRSHVPGLILERADGRTEGVLGDGQATLEAQVGGNVHLWPVEPEEGAAYEMPFDFATDLEGLGAQVEARVTEAMGEMEAHLHEMLGSADSGRIRRQVERNIEAARRTAEREAERARLRAERAERRWRRASGRRPHPKRPPATDEERMRVLRMVEEGKITPDQAADLLAALEGR